MPGKIVSPERVGPFPGSVPPVHVGWHVVCLRSDVKGTDLVAEMHTRLWWDGDAFRSSDKPEHQMNTTYYVSQWWGQPIPPAGKMKEAVNTLIGASAKALIDPAAHMAEITGQGENP